MNKTQIQAYFEGMLKAAFRASLFGGVVFEWQIDVVKELTSKAKESEIEHSNLSALEKAEMKRQLKERLDAFTQGLKDGLRREGRMV